MGPPMESATNKKPLLTEDNKPFNDYINELAGASNPKRETTVERAEVYDSESLLINEEFDKMIESLGKFVDKEKV